MKKECALKYLYKVISVEDWKLSHGSPYVHVPSSDAAFIHFSTEEQLQRICEKYWKGIAEYVVLKIDVALLKGKLVFEANEGGVNKYYHLYEGAIPSESIVEVS